MQTVRDLESLRAEIASFREKGETIALVPTMGALHDGHMALIEAAKTRADRVVASIFVNPRQFGPNEDLEAYPRQLAEDARLLDAEGVDLLWAPTADAMYPQGFATNISVSGVSEGLCGTARPGHFDGVATVVCKLFNQVRPDMALFGEKDWQQLAVIRRMAADLDLLAPHVSQVLGVPTVREADGLAMSSRNRYLSAEDRQRAAALPREMRRAIEQLKAGAPAAMVLPRLKAVLLSAGFARVDYAELADAAALTTLEQVGDMPARLLVAARIGGTRLIDNMAVV